METTGERRSLFQTMMDFAHLIKARSTCERLQVGCVVTTFNMESIISYGYNGNARKFPNKCDDPKAEGSCGCLHAEINTLLKVNVPLVNGKMFLTVSPCVMCAKAIINSQSIAEVIYDSHYRDKSAIEMLQKGNIDVVYVCGKYDWKTYTI